MSESDALNSLRKDFGMPNPYSDDLYGRAIVIVEGGASRHEVAGLFEVSQSTVINWLRRWPRCHAPHGHWKTITFVAGLRNDGMVAPFVFDGSMNRPPSSPIFNNVWRRRLLVAIASTWIICAHKVASVRQAIEATSNCSTLCLLSPSLKGWCTLIKSLLDFAR